MQFQSSFSHEWLYATSAATYRDEAQGSASVTEVQEARSDCRELEQRTTAGMQEVERLRRQSRGAVAEKH